MKSIISNDEECFFCGRTYGLHTHHIIYGNGLRPLSDKYGLTVRLCYEHHNGSDTSVHFCKEMDNALKDLAQRKFEETYPDLDFLKVFGRNYKQGD